MMYRKNDSVELDIVSVTNLGYGVGKNGESPVVFVPGTVTGEKVRALIIKVCRDYCIGKLTEVIGKSGLRDENQVCSAPSSCGGCPYRFLKYEEELRIKRENVMAEFRKSGIPEAIVMPVIHVLEPDGKSVLYGYRNKAQYRFVETRDGVSAGFYASGTHRVAGNIDCPLQPGIFADITRFVCRFAAEKGLSVFDEKTGKGILRHLYIRSSGDCSEVCVCIVINSDRAVWADELADKLCGSFPEITGVLLNINRGNGNVILGSEFITVKGKNGISDVFCDNRLDVSMEAFYQVNHRAAQILCDVAAFLLEKHGCGKDNSVFLDLYCGIGTIGLSVVKKSQKLIGVEIVPEAVECARKNAEKNDFPNAEFICADSFEGAREQLNRLSADDVICVDPPRKGCSPELLEAVDKSAAETFLYISCNPATLARDCAIMKSTGWKLSRVFPVNLFPRTGHVETVVLMSRHMDPLMHSAL